MHADLSGRVVRAVTRRNLDRREQDQDVERGRQPRGRGARDRGSSGTLPRRGPATARSRTGLIPLRRLRLTARPCDPVPPTRNGVAPQLRPGSDFQRVRLGHHIRTIAAKNQPEFLKDPARIVDSGVCRHDGKEAKRMGRDATGRRQGSVSGHDGDSPASPITVKVTLHLTVGTAQRLGVESAMRRISQSAIAEEVWRLT